MKMRESLFDDRIKWIGPMHADRITNEDTATPIETVYFSLDFNLDSETSPQGKLLLSAHSRYQLYINGKFITYGPCKSDEFRRYFEQLDLTGQLRKGANQILVKVVSFPVRECEKDGNVGPFWSNNKACGCCLFAAGEIQVDDRQIPLGTGIADWQYYISEEMMPVQDDIAFWLGYKEDVDGGKILQANNKDRKAAIPMFIANTTSYGELPLFPLYEREIPLLYMEQKNFQSTDITANSSVISPYNKKSFILDAGEHMTAFPRIHLSGGKGAVVTIRYAESYFHEENGEYVKMQRDDASGIIHGHADIYRPTDGDQIYVPFWFRTFRYIEITVETADNALTLYEPSYIETGYPLEELTTLSRDNEEWIHQIWEISLRTLRRCMHETYEDCPYYEQLQYTMDTRLQILFTYALNGDTRLARKTIHEYHSSKLPNGMLQSRYPCNKPQVIPVFSLHWIFMLEDYYQQTGDKDFVRGYIGTVDQILLYFRRCKKDGLVTDLGYWENVDWTPEWSDNNGVPHACQHGASTIQNLQYIYALQKSAKLMGIFGFHDLASSYQDEASTMNQVIIEQCYNGILIQEGPGLQDEYSQHAQMWAVLCKIGTSEMRVKLLHAILTNKQLIRCSYPSMFYMFRAFEQEGLYEQTEVLWDHWKVLLPLGLTTIPEMSFGNPRSDCHAWGSVLLYEFPRNILGVQHQDPHSSTICVEPKGFYIQKAEGTVHVPDGNIRIKRTVHQGTLHVEITPDCPHIVNLKLPDGTSHHIENKKTSVYTAKITNMNAYTQ